MPMTPEPLNRVAQTPLPPVLIVTFLISIGTGVVWNGIPFIARHDYGYSQQQSLVLYVAIGVMYAVGAMMSGHLLRRVERVMSPRAVLIAIFLGQTALCALPIIVTPSRDPHGVLIWLVASGTSILSSFMWPIVESYVSAGRHGAAMRDAIGWWTIAWTAAVAIALLLMAPLVEMHSARYAIVGMGVFNGIAIAVTWRFPTHPPVHDDGADAHLHAPPVYRSLLASVRVLLPLSYVLIGAMSPLMPYLLHTIGVELKWETPATAVWMSVRVFAVAVMWRVRFWHGRWSTLVIGTAAMAVGFAMTVLGGHLAILLSGLALFGVGQAIVYYAALYYAMAVGRAEVDASSVHEGLIGLGYGIGPAIGLAGLAIGGERLAVDGSLAGGEPTIVVLIFGVMVVGAIAAARPWLVARHP